MYKDRTDIKERKDSLNQAQRRFNVEEQLDSWASEREILPRRIFAYERDSQNYSTKKAINIIPPYHQLAIIEPTRMKLNLHIGRIPDRKFSLAKRCRAQSRTAQKRVQPFGFFSSTSSGAAPISRPFFSTPISLWLCFASSSSSSSSFPNRNSFPALSRSVHESALFTDHTVASAL